jgi:hypothetical protein
MRFAWAWGESGVCSDKRAFELRQIAGNLKRDLTLTPLTADGPPPVERPERIALISAKLAAEAELDEAKQRGVDLYNQNRQLANQVQALTVRAREREAQLAELNRLVAEHAADADRLRAELGDSVDELQRLRIIANVQVDQIERERGDQIERERGDTQPPPQE